MDSNYKYIYEMTELVEDALLEHDEPNHFDMEKDQPKYFSWFHIWWSFDHIVSEYGSALQYADAEEFQRQLIEKVRNVFNTTTLQYIRDGKITDFGMQIGPHTPSDTNLNQELGLDVRANSNEKT